MEEEILNIEHHVRDMCLKALNRSPKIICAAHLLGGFSLRSTTTLYLKKEIQQTTHNILNNNTKCQKRNTTMHLGRTQTVLTK